MNFRAKFPLDGLIMVLHAHEADFLQGLLKKKEKKLTRNFNSSFHYIDDVLSLNNSRFGYYLYCIYPKLKILLILKCLLLTITFTLKSTREEV